MPHPTIYFVRHGQTDWNAEYRLQGQRDIPINDKGRRQAKNNGQRLASLIDDVAKFRFIASPLCRTRETMEIIRAELDLPLHGYETEDRIKELTFGLWEGYTFDELRVDQNEAVERRFNEKWSFAPPHGESYAMLLDRVQTWLPTLDQESVVVTHGGILRVLHHKLAGMGTTEVTEMKAYQDRVLKWDGKNLDWIT